MHLQNLVVVYQISQWQLWPWQPPYTMELQLSELRTRWEWGYKFGDRNGKNITFAQKFENRQGVFFKDYYRAIRIEK